MERRGCQSIWLAASKIVDKVHHRHNALSLDEDRQLVEPEDPLWTPRSVRSVLDGISACRWALILTQYGEEDETHNFAEFMQQRARARPVRMEHMLAYWLSSMWKVAMAMRNGDSFGIATQAIMQGMEAFHDYMNKDVSSLRPKPKTPIKADSPDKSYVRPGKGGKAKGGMGSQLRYQPYPRTRWPQSEYNKWRCRVDVTKRILTSANRTFQCPTRIGGIETTNRDSSGPAEPPGGSGVPPDVGNVHLFPKLSATAAVLSVDVRPMQRSPHQRRRTGQYIVRP